MKYSRPGFVTPRFPTMQWSWHDKMQAMIPATDPIISDTHNILPFSEKQQTSTIKSRLINVTLIKLKKSTSRKFNANLIVQTNIVVSNLQIFRADTGTIIDKLSVQGSLIQSTRSVTTWLVYKGSKYVTSHLSGVNQIFIKRPLRWKRMVACKRGLGSGPLLFSPDF